MMRRFGQHELGGACQGIETGLGQGAQLELAVAVGKVGEHIEGQPVGSLLVEGAQNARAVLVAGIALQQGIGLFAAIATEVAVQQVHHSPQVAALFDIDRSEEHTSELQSLMRISYAVFCLKKKRHYTSHE